MPLAAASLGVLTFNVCGNMIITAPLSAMDTVRWPSLAVQTARVRSSGLADEYMPSLLWHIPLSAQRYGHGRLALL